MALNDEQKKLLSDLWNTSYGKALFVFLEDEFSKIGDISTIKSWEEVQGRQHAIELIRKLFSFIRDRKSTERKLNQYE